jgi:hypothetical protein
MQRVIGEVGEKIRTAAQADAPVGPLSDPHRGEYKASFEPVHVAVEKTSTGDRAVARVVNSSPHAVAVEYGRGGSSETEGQSAHHTLTKAIDAARL